MRLEMLLIILICLISKTAWAWVIQTPQEKIPSEEVPIADDTVEKTSINCMTLAYRNIVIPPTDFTPINKRYRALYSATVINRPEYGGKVMTQLIPGADYVALGQVESDWIALANEEQDELIGYVPANSVVESLRYRRGVHE